MSFGERFLRHPDLFPARTAGEPWGAAEIVLDLPGGPYRVSGLRAAQEEALQRRFAGFITEAKGGVSVRVLRVAAAEFRSFDLRGWEFTLDLDGSADALRIAGLDLMARIEWRPDAAAALWSPAAEGDAFSGACENLLRVLVAYRLLQMGGALLHSAAVADDSGALLFLGPSGAGKTTLTRLALGEGRSVLSDDLNAVVPGPRGPVVVPVPFAGDFRASPGSAKPLCGLLRLRHGERHTAEPLGRAATLASLLACAPYVNQDAHRLDALMAVCAGLTDAVPARLLSFAQREGVWDALTGAAVSAR